MRGETTGEGAALGSAAPCRHRTCATQASNPTVPAVARCREVGGWEMVSRFA